MVYDNIPNMPPTTSIKALDDILQVFPVKITSVIVVHVGECGEHDTTFYDTFLPVALKTLLHSPVDDDHDAILAHRSRIYVKKSRDEILEELHRDGFRRENLPVVLGGNWSAVHHRAWLKVRVEEERHQEAQCQSHEEFSFPEKEATTAIVPVGKAREKIRDALHSKFKRVRKRCRTKALEIRIKHLNDQQNKLKSSTMLLERALKDANQIVAAIEARKAHPFVAGVPSVVSVRRVMPPSSLPSMMLYSGRHDHHLYGQDPRSMMEAAVTASMRSAGGLDRAVRADSLMELSAMRSGALEMAARAEQDMILLARMSSAPQLVSMTPPVARSVYPSQGPLSTTTPTGAVATGPPSVFASSSQPSANWSSVTVATEGWPNAIGTSAYHRRRWWH